MFQAMSTSTMMIGSVSNVSAIPDPFKTSLSPSLSSYYKSLPALDKQHSDQLDKELRHLSESVDILYEQEDSEIEPHTLNMSGKKKRSWSRKRDS